MATGTTTTAEWDFEVEKYFNRGLWEREKRYDIFNLCAVPTRIPAKNSRTYTTRRADPLDDTPKVLQEGVTSALEQLSKHDIDIVLQQFGNGVGLSDRVVIEVQDDTSNEVMDMLSQNMFEMLDKVTRDVLQSGATQIDAINGSNGNTPTEITAIDLDVVVDFLNGNNGKKWTPDIPGVDAYGTEPVERAFWAMTHTDLRKDIRALASFLPPAKYPQRDALEPEMGSTDNIRWLGTSAGAIESADPDIYSTFISAQNAYAISQIDDVATEMIIKPLGAGDDPWNQRQTMTWKATFGAGVIVDEWLANFRTTRSDA